MKTIVPVVFLLTLSTAAAAQTNPDWHAQFPAFKIAGNLYYVGTADLAVYLIRTPQGNILINSDFAEDVPTVRKSIEQLGFKYSDTKIILISHAHGDHDEGVRVPRRAALAHPGDLGHRRFDLLPPHGSTGALVVVGVEHVRHRAAEHDPPHRPLLGSGFATFVTGILPQPPAAGDREGPAGSDRVALDSLLPRENLPRVR